MSNEACVLCREGQVQPIRRFTSDPFAGRDISLGECRACGAAALVPRPSDQLIAAQYENYFRRRTGEAVWTKVAYGRWLLQRLRLPLQQASILDAGAGEGHLMRALNLEYPMARVFGVEPLWSSALGADLRATVYAEPLEPFLATHSHAAFDAVFMLDVLEHLVDPRQVLEHIGQLLRPGGWIIATMPSADASSRRVLGPLWPQYKVEHLHYFSRTSLQAMASAAGLSVQRIEPHVKRLPLGYLRNVGQSFGPPLVQRATRVLGQVLPDGIADWQLSLRFGEWLFVAQRAPA